MPGAVVEPQRTRRYGPVLPAHAPAAHKQIHVAVAVHIVRRHHARGGRLVARKRIGGASEVPGAVVPVEAVAQHSGRCPHPISTVRHVQVLIAVAIGIEEGRVYVLEAGLGGPQRIRRGAPKRSIGLLHPQRASKPVRAAQIHIVAAVAVYVAHGQRRPLG